ncbi:MULTISPECIES: hypothetical protein [unclassified Lysinibacillus]|uniref:hypothetical protein n=1 Tax=unclassified Lysinibacillus TaxID=2636778 RepID=UPI002556D4A1|nr:MULTISPECIES: hypothetical protein [unclassified Lysinibacillus]MDM5246242.1 hypothetical protein [Lysinibacillus sp. G4S2]
MGISITVETLLRSEAGRPQESLLCAKAKRQRQSPQSEWKSTPLYGDEPNNKESNK